MKTQTYSPTLPLTLVLDWGWKGNTMPWPFYHWEKDPVPIVQEAEWASGPARTGTKNLAPTGVETWY